MLALAVRVLMLLSLSLLLLLALLLLFLLGVFFSLLTLLAFREAAPALGGLAMSQSP